MAAADVQPPPTETASALPDYLTDPNAVLTDTGVKWRYGRAPDYTKTRKMFAESKQMNHQAGSLPQLVENLVKNWEVEASFKTNLADWRTVDGPNYTFAINGGPPQSGEHMLKVGTYNAIIAPNEYYSPVNSDFASSHKTFKRMMPTFAWEVLEVYAGPPQVAFRWRHWGVMKNDYVGFNDKGEKVTAKAHGGPIDMQGVTIATVDDKVRLQRVETWFDPMDMFRQIAPQGIINKESVSRRVSPSPAPSAKAVPAPGPAPQRNPPADTLRPAVYNPFSGDAAPPYQPGSTELQQPAEQQTISDKQADQLPRALYRSNHVQDAEGNSRPTESESGQQPGLFKQPQQESQLEPHASSQMGREYHEHVKEQDQVLVFASEHPFEVDQWHETRDGMSTALGGEPEKFHDAVDDHADSTASSEAGSWTAVTPPASDPPTPRRSNYSSGVTGAMEHGRTDGQTSHLDAFFECPAPHPKDMEDLVGPSPGDAVAASPDSEEVRLTHLEMSRITPMECPFLMNRE